MYVEMVLMAHRPYLTVVPDRRTRNIVKKRRFDGNDNVWERQSGIEIVVGQDNHSIVLEKELLGDAFTGPNNDLSHSQVLVYLRHTSRIRTQVCANLTSLPM